MNQISKRQILFLHSELIAITGGIDGLRDEGLLDSALAAPFQSFAGQEIYPSIQQKAVRLCFGLVKNHPFLDGNKRIGAHAMLDFLAINGIELNNKKGELSNVILALAAGKIGQDELLQWVENKMVWMEKTVQVAPLQYELTIVDLAEKPSVLTPLREKQDGIAQQDKDSLARDARKKDDPAL